MYSNHHLGLWSLRNSFSQPLYPYDVDDVIEKLAVRDLVSRRLHRRHLLPSDIYCHSDINAYKPLRPYPISTRYQSLNPRHSYDLRPILPRPITPVEYPLIHHFDRYQPPVYCKNCHRYDFSSSKFLQS